MLDLSIVLWCVVLLVEGNDRSLFLDSLTASITEGATVAAKRSINCENLIQDLTDDGFYSSCLDSYDAVQIQNNTIILQYNWLLELADRESRCYCALSLLSTMKPRHIDIFSSGLCSENGSFACEPICDDRANQDDQYAKNNESCGSVHNCANKKCLIYYSDGTYYTQLLNSQLKAILLVISSGITCDVIMNHRKDFCDLLYANDSTMASDTKSDTSIIVGSIVATTAVFVCLAGSILLGSGIYYRRRKEASKDSKEEKALEHPGSPIKNFPFVNTVNFHNVLYSHKETESFLILYKSRLENVLIKRDNLKITCELGQGAFGIVYKGLIVDSDVDVAVKILKDSATSDDIQDFLAESAIMLEFDHPNVLKLMGICFETDHGLPMIVLPYMVNGALKDLLVASRIDTSVEQLPEGWGFNRLKMMCSDIAKGMEHLSENKFVHRDLAARNCMVDEYFSVKVADFGFARDIYGDEYYRLKRKARLPVKWLSPESLFDNIYNEKTDVWAFGVTCWEVYSLGRTPYPAVDNADIPDYIESGKRLHKPSLCGQNMYSVMAQCWSSHPKERPTFRELVSIIQGMSLENVDVKDPVYFVLENSCLESEDAN